MQDVNRIHKKKYTSNQIKNNLPKGFCAAPFTQMFLYPDGEAFVCCEGGGHLGNIKKYSLEELWNGEKAKKIRREFLEGNPKQCKKNIECKKCHLNYTEDLIEAELKEVVEKPPQVLDLIINGKCNIDCVMCEVKNEHRSLMNEPRFISEIVEKVLPEVKKVSIKSGEPFVQKETYWIFDQIAAINPACEVRVTTNGQYIFNDKIREAIEKINLGRVTFSIDSIFKDTFEKIRHLGSLTKLLKVIENFKAWRQSTGRQFVTEFHANITLQRDNWKDVPETYKFLIECKIHPHIIFVEKPKIYSLSALPDKEFVEVALFYLQLPEKYDRFILELFAPIISACRAREKPIFIKLALMLQKKIADIPQKKVTCTLPFTQLSIFPNGKLRPCCWMGNYNLSEENNGEFIKTWNDIPMQEIRRQFVENKLNFCKNLVEKTSCNSRNLLPSEFYDVSLTIDRPPQKLHWYFSGACNLECPSCKNWHYKDEFPENEIYWEKLKEEIFPHLCEIEVVGGEPFYQKRTFQLIDTMSQINPDCLWYFTSNGQFKFVGAIRNAIDKVKITHFSVSIDSLVPGRFAFLRKNGILEKTLQFLEDLNAYKNGLDIKRRFYVHVNFVLQQENYKELRNFFEFSKAKGITLYIIPLIDPSKLSIYEFPKKVKQEILNELISLSELYPQVSINVYDLIQDLNSHLLNGSTARNNLHELSRQMEK